MNMKELILTVPNALDSETCGRIIDSFEKEALRDNKCFNSGIHYNTYNKNNKGFPFDKLLDVIKTQSLEYIKHHISTPIEGIYVMDFHLIKHDSSNTRAFSFFNQEYIVKGKMNILNFQFFLNDVDNDGEISISNAEAIAPKCGTFTLFPHEWFYAYTEYAPKEGAKYFIKGIVSIPIDNR